VRPPSRHLAAEQRSHAVARHPTEFGRRESPGRPLRMGLRPDSSISGDGRSCWPSPPKHAWDCHRLLIMEGELTLRIVLETPPADIVFGLQKGRGSAYETVQKQRSTGEDLAFEFVVSVAGGHPPGFSGPFAQGPRGQRFVYIDIGTAAGQMDSCWSRRLKVPLAGITESMIAARATLEARVPGTGRDGGPSCATVKDFDGWKIAVRRPPAIAGRESRTHRKNANRPPINANERK